MDKEYVDRASLQLEMHNRYTVNWTENVENAAITSQDTKRLNTFKALASLQ